MQIDYARDHARRCVRVTLRGEYHPDEILAMFERHRLEDDWSYGRLYDASGVTGRPTVEELRSFMKLDAQHRPHGPEAILTTDPILYSAACLYAALGRSTLTIEVFRDTVEAEQWLAAQRTEGDATP